ncbi:uncharacterized protein TRIADDRAFT_32265, partial [Trichoplax adhaerens]
PRLYSYFRSTCSWRVRIALALKGIEYDYHPVHLLKDGGEQASFKDNLNPNSLLPALEIDGHCLADSMSIIEYLDETRQDPPYLLPKDPAIRATVRRISNNITSGIQPIQNLRVLIYVGADKKKEWGKHWIEQGFNSLEELLEKTSGKYCVGDDITMADLCLIPQVYNANRFEVDMSRYPIITRINAQLENHDAFVAAHPRQQPDCPDELK